MKVYSLQLASLRQVKLGLAWRSGLTVNRSSTKPSYHPTIQPSNWRRKRPGVTLVELLIYMALVSIFIITLTDIFSSILTVRTESEATSTVEEDGRFILSRLNYDIARAGSINIPPQIGQTKSNLRMDISSITYEYAENGGNLQLSNDQGTNNINSSETTVSSLSFTRIANSSIPDTKDTIKIQFTLTSKTQRVQGPETKTFTTTVGLR